MRLPFHSLRSLSISDFSSPRRSSGLLTVLAACLVAPSGLAAQQAAVAAESTSLTASAAAMDAAQAGAPPAADDQPQPQTKRILGLIPNFRAVSADEKLPPETLKEKFMDATQDSFDYSSIFLPAALAGYSMGTNATPEFHQGAAGFGRYLWHSAVDQTSENYWVEFIVPSLAHEDTRFYTLGRGGFVKRSEYALSRVIVTRSDSGARVFNAGEVLGAGISSGMSNLYYPSAERTFANTGKQWGLDVGVDAASFMFKEFWPDINHKLFHGEKPAAGAAR